MNVLALVDSGLLQLFGLIVSSVTAVLLAWIAFRQAALQKAQAELNQTVVTLEKNTNHIKDALVAVTKEAGIAQGKVEGRREFERENKPTPPDFSEKNPGHIAVVEEPKEGKKT